MKMSLLHALAAILTVLLLVVQQRHVLAALCSKNFKYCGLSNKEYFDQDFCFIPFLSKKITICSRYEPYLTNPKCKKDPEIHVDNEEIGQHPYED